MAPPSSPAPQHLIQAPRVLMNVEGRFEEGRGNDSLVPYTQVNSLKSKSPFDEARFTNKFAVYQCTFLFLLFIMCIFVFWMEFFLAGLKRFS